MFCHPGKKLLFMGAELAQWSEWDSEKSIDWGLLNYDQHKGIQTLVRDLNRVYREQKPLHQIDFDWGGFQWVDFSDADNGILAFIRRSKKEYDAVVCIFNFTPQVHYDYVIGVPRTGSYKTVFNSDSEFYGGSNFGNLELVAEEGEFHNQPAHVRINIPPLAGIIIKST